MRVPRKHHEKVFVRGKQSGGPFTHTIAKRSRKFLTFCHNVPTGSQKCNKNTDETLESETQSALAENNFYKTSDHRLQKRENLLKDMLVTAKI